MAAPAWLAALEPLAPDVVAVWQAIDDEGPRIRGIAFRREIRRRAGPGTAATILAQQEAIADALGAVLSEMPEPLLRAPGGEGDWNVAQAFAHTTGARRWLAHAAALAARGEWPAEAPGWCPASPAPPTRRSTRCSPSSPRAAARSPPRPRRSPGTRPSRVPSTTRWSATCAAGSGSSSPASTT